MKYTLFDLKPGFGYKAAEDGTFSLEKGQMTILDNIQGQAFRLEILLQKSLRPIIGSCKANCNNWNRVHPQ